MSLLSRHSAAVGILLGAVSASVWANPPSRVADRIAAVVNGRVITQSELDFEARVVFINHGAIGAADGDLDDAARHSALDLAINQRLQEAEADKLRAFPVDRSELDAALFSFRDRFSTLGEYQKFLARHEADDTQVASILERTLRAEKMLDSKLKLRAQVSENDVRAYYETHAQTLRLPYADIRQQLRDKLFRERYAQMAKAELESLRSKADVRSVAPFARVKAGQGRER